MWGGCRVSGLNIVVSLDVGTDRSDEMKSGSRCLIYGVNSVWIRLPDSGPGPLEKVRESFSGQDSLRVHLRPWLIVFLTQRDHEDRLSRSGPALAEQGTGPWCVKRPQSD
jgi:hypothetical protein